MENLKIKIIVSDEEGEIYSSEIDSFESAYENLGKIERAIENKEDNFIQEAIDDLEINNKIMKYKEKGQNYEIYEDGSVKISCHKCLKEDFLGPDHKFSIRFIQLEVPNKGNDYVCFSCWKKNKEKEKETFQDNRTNDILKGQATNLAVLTMLKIGNPEDKDFFLKVDEWKERYIKYLKN